MRRGDLGGSTQSPRATRGGPGTATWWSGAVSNKCLTIRGAGRCPDWDGGGGVQTPRGAKAGSAGAERVPAAWEEVARK